MDVSEGLTRKIGPLPVWAWGGVVGGTILVVRAATGGSGGASSPFVTPIATDIPFDYDSLSGAGGGSSGGGTASPPTSSPPSANPPISRPRTWPTKADIASWRPRRPLPVATAPVTRIGPRAKIASGPIGDTVFSSSGEGDSTPVTPTPAVPWSVPPVPIGNRLTLPALDAIPDYVGPTVDTLTPIASSARVLMPPVNGQTSGSVVVPRLPKASARADTRGARLGDSVRVIQDRIGAWHRTLPTTRPTVSAPLRILRDWRDRTPTG